MLAVIILTGCVTIPETVIPEPASETVFPLEIEKNQTRTEHEVKSLELFNEILNITWSSNDRQSFLPRIEALYTQIIIKYPDTPLAQESYWRLIAVYINDYSPPNFDKAKARYNEFRVKYPLSPVRVFVDDTIGNGYYKHEKWNSLLELSRPIYNEYIESGKRTQPFLMFMYSEANYHLGNIDEAEKGYKIVSELYPRLIAGKKSASMLKKIEEIRN
jgi:hypothetical protein